MITGLKSNIPLVIKTCPEKEISGEWLKDELVSLLQLLHENGFNVRAIVCDTHARNIYAFKKLIQSYSAQPTDLSIEVNNKKIYLP